MEVVIIDQKQKVAVSEKESLLACVLGHICLLWLFWARPTSRESASLPWDPFPSSLCRASLL